MHIAIVTCGERGAGEKGGGGGEKRGEGERERGRWDILILNKPIQSLSEGCSPGFPCVSGYTYHCTVTVSPAVTS